MPYKDEEKRKRYNKDYQRKYRKESRRKNRDSFIEKETKWRANNPAKRLIYSTRQSAKERGLVHEITEEDLALPEICPYLGVTLDYSAGTGKTMSKPSVDRIDSTKGYIKGNVEVISTFANTMKNRATKEELLLFAKEVIRRYGTDL